MKSFSSLNQQITGCTRCPRLRTHCATITQVKRAAYKTEVYWGKPVPGFGSPKARLWIVGLAPGAHGANRTGRVFTGDSSGDWLYSALYRFGFSSAPNSLNSNDELRLLDTYISCVCRCAPPDNKPTLKEIANCSSYLAAEWELLKSPPLILTLGQIAFQEIIKLLMANYQIKRQSDWKFRHGALYKVGETRVMVSYHPSQQNTATKRLTLSMWNAIFKRASRELKDHSLRKD
ncbi:MAG: uracil-DNA glycosylase [Proteobacteria bacterium]|nr:uracil-DNA glycosylase [Pseudomonadota bacterium]